jgi:hypothetical protein
MRSSCPPVERAVADMHGALVRAGVPRVAPCVPRVDREVAVSGPAPAAEVADVALRRPAVVRTGTVRLAGAPASVLATWRGDVTGIGDPLLHVSARGNPRAVDNDRGARGDAGRHIDAGHGEARGVGNRIDRRGGGDDSDFSWRKADVGQDQVGLTGCAVVALGDRDDVGGQSGRRVEGAAHQAALLGADLVLAEALVGKGAVGEGHRHPRTTEDRARGAGEADDLRGRSSEAPHRDDIGRR